MTTDKEFLVAACRPRIKRFEIKSLGREFFIRSMTAKELMTFVEQYNNKLDSIEAVVSLAILCLVHEDGEQMFVEGERATLEKLELAALMEITDVCVRHCGLNDETTAKN